MAKKKTTKKATKKKSKKTTGPRKEGASKGGRPRKEVDQEQFEALCRLNPTLNDVAAFFKVDPETVVRRCREWGYKSFVDMRQQNMVHTRLKLIRTAVKKAENGDNIMLIFCLKNLCGWSDKREDKVTTEASTLNVTLKKESE